MKLSDYCKEDAHGLARLIKAKKLKPYDALSFALTRMREVNPSLNAIVTDCSEWALKQLKLMDGSEPFYGVPVLVKDLGFEIKDITHSEGSRFLFKRKSIENSDFINRLLALGMLPFAKTNVPELGLSYVTESVLFGPCRNPYDLTRTPGGSSGGSAAAVAAGVAPIATANDGGGSIRIPAACCGLFGFKPTPGLMPTGPFISEAWSGLATGHVLSRSVRDSSLLFDLLTAKSDLTTFKRPYRKKKQSSLIVALVEGAFAAVPVAAECLDALEKAQILLKELGHQIVKRSLVLDLDAIGDAAMLIIAANTAEIIETMEMVLGRPAQIDEIEPVTWEFMCRGKAISAADLIRAKNTLYQLTRPVHHLLSEVDLILTPALAQLPLTIGSLPIDMDFTQYLQKNVEFSPFTSLFNQAGLPAMTIPIMRHGNLPLSIQCAAGRGRDRLLLDVAREIEAKVGESGSLMQCRVLLGQGLNLLSDVRS